MISFDKISRHTYIHRNSTKLVMTSRCIDIKKIVVTQIQALILGKYLFKISRNLFYYNLVCQLGKLF